MNYANNSGIIQYNNRTDIVDMPDLLHLCTFKTPTKSAVMSDKGNSYHALEKCEGVKIINFNHSFVFSNSFDEYPSFASNVKRYNYIEFIYSIHMDNAKYQFTPFRISNAKSASPSQLITAPPPPKGAF